MAEIKDPENTIIMETTTGKVVIQLLPKLLRATLPVSRNWYRKALTTASCSTASSKTSWPRRAM